MNSAFRRKENGKRTKQKQCKAEILQVRISNIND
jgi:hypothetical protein